MIVWEIFEFLSKGNIWVANMLHDKALDLRKGSSMKGACQERRGSVVETRDD